MKYAMLPAKEFSSTAYAYEDLLIYALQIGDGLILNADGGLMRSWRFAGKDLESSSSAELIALSERINDVIRRLPVGWMLHVDSLRRCASGYPLHSRFPDRTSWLVDETRRVDFHRNDAHFVSEHVLSATYLCPRDKTAQAWAFFRDADVEEGTHANTAMMEALKEFHRGIECIERGFGEDLRLARLGRCTVEAHNERWVADEQVQHLLVCATGIDLPVRAVPIKTDLAPVIGNQHLRNGDRLRIGDRVIGVLSVSDVPNVSCPGIFDLLNQQTCTYRVSHRYIVEDELRARKEIDVTRRKHFQGRKSVIAQVVGTADGPHIDGEAHRMASDASAALDDLRSGEVVFGYWSMSIIFMVTIGADETEKAAIARLQTSLKDVAAAINRLGFTVRDEDVNTLEVFLGSLPGHGHPNLRRAMLSSRNLADFLPTTSIWAGESHCPCPMYPPGSPPLAVVRTTGTAPFHLNLHVGDVGHTMIVGPTGSGKSTFLAFLLAQHRRYPGARQIAIDLEYSLYTLCKAVGGQHHIVSGSGAPTFAPLQHIEDLRERAVAESWIGMLLDLQGVDPNPRREAIYLALETLANSPHRSLTDLTLTPFLDAAAKRALRWYTVAREGGGLLDATSNLVGEHDCTVFEFDEIRNLGKEMALPTLTHIFHRIDGWLRQGTPSLFAVDEVWTLLRDPGQAAQMESWLRTLRKRNTAAVFATQHLEDIADSAIAATLIQSCPTKIFLANPEAAAPINRAAYAAFGLTDWQITMIAKARPKRDYYVVQPGGKRMITLDLDPAALAFLGVSDPKDVRTVRDLIEQDRHEMAQAGTPQVAWWPATWLTQRAGEQWAQRWIEGPDAA